LIEGGREGSNLALRMKNDILLIFNVTEKLLQLKIFASEAWKAKMVQEIDRARKGELSL
jgi:hypothetical protein